MIDRYWCEEEELRNNWCMAQRRSPASGILVCITHLPPPTPTHNIILFSFLICHINTILFFSVFSDKYHSGHPHSIFPLYLCYPQFWVSLFVEGPFFSNKRRRSKTVRLQEMCREKGDNRWHWFPMIGYCQRYFIPIGILPTCPKIQSKLVVVPFRKRHSVIPVSRVCIFGNIE